MELPRSDVNGSRCGAHIIIITHERGFAVFDTESVARTGLGMPSSVSTTEYSALAEPRTELKLRSAAGSSRQKKRGRPIYCSAACQALGTT